MSDRALLEDAARAAGIDLWAEWDESGLNGRYRIGQDGDQWNSLQDDGDALRLAVKLKMLVGKGECDCCIEAHCDEFDEPIRVRYSPDFRDCETTDPYAATRRAITRAAAEIWRTRNDRS